MPFLTKPIGEANLVVKFVTNTVMNTILEEVDLAEICSKKQRMNTEEADDTRHWLMVMILIIRDL